MSLRLEIELIHHTCIVNGKGNGNPLQSSCLENPMNRGAWWAAVHGVSKSWTWLSDWPWVAKPLWKPLNDGVTVMNTMQRWKGSWPREGKGLYAPSHAWSCVPPPLACFWLVSFMINQWQEVVFLSFVSYSSESSTSDLYLVCWRYGRPRTCGVQSRELSCWTEPLNCQVYCDFRS